VLMLIGALIRNILSIYSPDCTNICGSSGGEFEGVESLRGQGQCRGLKVVKSCPNGHFLFTSSDTSAVRCIV